MLLQQNHDWIVPKVAPLVKVLQFDAPDAQFEGADAVLVQPGESLTAQPDVGVQHEVPQHEFAVGDELISVDLTNGSGQVGEPWIVRRAVEAVWATKHATKNTASDETDINSCNR